MRTCGLVPAVLFVFLAGGCEDKLKPSVVPISPAQLPSQESWNSTVVYTDSGQVRAVLWAGHIAVFAQGQYTLLSDSIHVDFFDDMGKHSSTLTARRGRVNDRTEDLEADERVHLVSDEGTVLKTERLSWHNATRTIRSDTFVEILSPREQLTGHGLVSDQGLKNYRILRVAGQAVTQE